MAKPTWDDTEEIVDEIPSFEDTEEISEPSKLESGLRGALQGGSMGFADEAQAAIEAMGQDIGQVLGLTEASEEEPVTFDEQGRPVIPEDSGRAYKEKIDKIRAQYKAAQEANPATYIASEIGGGILPALLTGGGVAAAKTAGAVTKGGLGTAMKEGAKLGAKYGAVSGAGYSEGETPLEVAGDVAASTAIGTVGGAALPAAIEGGKQVLGAGKRGVQKLLSALIPEEEAIKAGYKYGRAGKALNQENLDADLKVAAKQVLKNIKSAKNKNSLEGIKQQLDDLGIKVDTKEAIDEAIKDLEKIAKEDMLDLSNKDLLPKLKRLAGIDIQEEKLIQQAEKAATKKAIQSSETKANQLDSDLAYDPVIESGTAGGRPVVNTTDLSTGKVNTIVGNIEDKVEKDLSNMTVSEVEALRKQLNLATNMAKLQGTADDPVMQRARDLAVTLKELTDAAVEKEASSDLVGKRATMSKILSAEELLGIKKRMNIKGDIDEAMKVNQLAGKLGFEKGFKTRQEAELASELLPEGVMTPKLQEEFNLMKTLNQVVGRESQENISRAGLYKKAVGDVPNLAGRGVRQVEKVIAPAKKAAKAVTDMSAEQLGSFANKLQSSQSKGMQAIGSRLTEALAQEGTAQSQAIWALSQSPAFREMVKRHTEAHNELDIPAFENFMKEPESLPSENTESSQNQNIKSSEHVDTIAEVENEIDRVNKQQSSGDMIPINQLDSLLEKINKLQVSQDVIDDLENQATSMESFADGQRLKEQIRQLRAME